MRAAPLFVLALLSTSIPTTLPSAHARAPSDPAAAAIESILKTFAKATAPSGASGAAAAAPTKAIAEFNVAGCAIPLPKWAPYLVGGSLTHRFSFGPGCDLDGPLTMTHEPFPIDLRVRHLADFKRLRATLTVTPNLEFDSRQVSVSIAADKGILTDAQDASTEFRGRYACFIGLDGRIIRGPAKTGGTLHLSRLRGKPIDLDAPIPGP